MGRRWFNARSAARNSPRKYHAGRRVDLYNIFFRARSEANYARYLNWLKTNGEILDWQYEPQTFWFDGIRRGTCSYKPDFKVTEKNGTHHWLELKGFMTKQNLTALKRMKKYFPEEHVRVVTYKEYLVIQKQIGALIPGWE